MWIVTAFISELFERSGDFESSKFANNNSVKIRLASRREHRLKAKLSDLLETELFEIRKHKLGVKTSLAILKLKFFPIFVSFTMLVMSLFFLKTNTSDMLCMMYILPWREKKCWMWIVKLFKWLLEHFAIKFHLKKKLSPRNENTSLAYSL